MTLQEQFMRELDDWGTPSDQVVSVIDQLPDRMTRVLHDHRNNTFTVVRAFQGTDGQVKVSVDIDHKPAGSVVAELVREKYERSY